MAPSPSPTPAPTRSPTPQRNFNGRDSFTYTVSDGTATSAAARVIITVNAVPIAMDDAATTNEDTPVDIDVTDNDSDVETAKADLTVAIATNPANGSVNNASPDTVTYTSNANFPGSDSFTYTVSDGTDTSNAATVRVTVNAVNDPPVAMDDAGTTNECTPVDIDVTANDTDVDNTKAELSVAAVGDPSNGTVVINADGTVKYTPAENFHGEDSFTYTVSDGTGTSNAATVTVTLNATIPLDWRTHKGTVGGGYKYEIDVPRDWRQTGSSAMNPAWRNRDGTAGVEVQLYDGFRAEELWRHRNAELLEWARRWHENHPDLAPPVFKKPEPVKPDGTATMWPHPIPFAYLSQASSGECVRDVFEIVGESLIPPVEYSIRLEAWGCGESFCPRRMAERCWRASVSPLPLSLRDRIVSRAIAS